MRVPTGKFSLVSEKLNNTVREVEEGVRERKALTDTLAERNRVSVVLYCLHELVTITSHDNRSYRVGRSLIVYV